MLYRRLRLMLIDVPKPSEYADFIYDVLVAIGQVFFSEDLEKPKVKRFADVLLRLEPGIYIARDETLKAGGAIVVDSTLVIGRGAEPPTAWVPTGGKVWLWFKRSVRALQRKGIERFKREEGWWKKFVEWEEVREGVCARESGTNTNSRRGSKRQDSSSSDSQPQEERSTSISRHLTEFISG